MANKTFDSAEDFPSSVPIFPLSGALLSAKGQMPLNIFEPRYLGMIDAALAGDRLIGMTRLPGRGGRDPNGVQSGVGGLLGRNGKAYL